MAAKAPSFLDFYFDCGTLIFISMVSLIYPSISGTESYVFGNQWSKLMNMSMW